MSYRKRRSSSSNPAKKTDICDKCGHAGHWASSCYVKPANYKNARNSRGSSRRGSRY